MFSIPVTWAVFPKLRLRFVADAGLDDQKVFAWMEKVDAEFVIRASHLERRIEVYNLSMAIGIKPPPGWAP